MLIKLINGAISMVKKDVRCYKKTIVDETLFDGVLNNVLACLNEIDEKDDNKLSNGNNKIHLIGKSFTATYIKDQNYKTNKNYINFSFVNNLDLKNCNWITTNFDSFNKEIKDIKKDKFVYLIYNNDCCLYVGKAINIRTRLKNHLYKNTIGTKSKISEVYNLIDSTAGKLELKIKILDINPSNIYSTIEGLLIDHFEKNNQAEWNKRLD